MFGLKEDEVNQIKILLKTNGIHNALIFGSRAKGNYKAGSDIDLAIDKDENKISYLLNEETNLAYYFDVVNINKLKNKNLIEHIKRVGIAI